MEITNPTESPLSYTDRVIPRGHKISFRGFNLHKRTFIYEDIFDPGSDSMPTLINSQNFITGSQLLNGLFTLWRGNSSPGRKASTSLVMNSQAVGEKGIG